MSAAGPPQERALQSASGPSAAAAAASVGAQTTAGAQFRAAVAAEKPLQVAGAINAYAARMAERVGFKALYLSGGGVAANSLGMPDLGISTLDDVLIDVRRITDVTTLPLLVDIDTGWGSAFNIARTIRSMIRAGAAAVHIEDQVGAKRCGHRPGKEVVAKAEMVDRVKAAVDARTDPSFVIMARTDALAVEGIDAAIERAVAYVEAGADMIFPEAMTELAMYKRFRSAVNVPILANITEFGQTPLFTTDELRSADVDIVLYCCSAYRAMNAAALNVYRTIRREGTQKSVVPLMQTRTELYDFLGYHDYEKKLDALFAQQIDASR
ncbi:MAG TPA: methylisocitrate lyase [Casimicrobiaceae bacterium]|jgi:methylisocitrate lyase